MKTIRKTWKMLGENIYIGERYERNMKSIAVLSVIMAAAGLVMLIVNLASREYSVAMTSVPFMVTGGVTWYFTGMDPARADRYALLRRAGIDPETGSDILQGG